MRIVVWGINYAPELTGIGPCNTALCEYLAAKGHQVEMLTTFPYYPSWSKRPEDSGTLFRTDELNGVRVRRCWHYVPSVVTSRKRIFHELSFVVISMIRLLFLKRPDALVVVSPPLLLGFAAWVMGLAKRTPFVFHVQDLQPDAAVGLGMLKPGLMVRCLYWLERVAYRKASKVSGISQGMLRAFAEKGVDAEKLVYFPNGVAFGPEPIKGLFRTRYGFAPDDFLAVYSGNLGAKQGLGTLIDAAPLIRQSRVKIVICGDGANRDELIAKASGKQIFFLPLQAEAEYRQMLADTDLCLITQAPGTGRVFFPSKLLSALAQSTPVLSVADAESELARAVEEARCGLNLLPGHPAALAGKLDDLAADPGNLAGMGERGRAFVTRFEFQQTLGGFEQMLCQMEG